MEKYFLCMALSYKYGGKCIGGVELEKSLSTNTYTIVKENGRPKWIRPVTRNTDHGQISNDISAQFHIMDIIKIEGAQACPDCAQSENFYFSGISKISSVNSDVKTLDILCDSYHKLIFGNKGRAVAPESYENLEYSLMLVKPENVNFFMEKRYSSDVQRLRVSFDYNGHEYNLPVTDPKICQNAPLNIEQLNSSSSYYLTLSLGVEHEGWHSKLVANVAAIQFEAITQIRSIDYERNRNKF